MTALVVFAVLCQVLPAAPGEGVQLERIRKALDHTPAITTEAETDQAGRPVFRMSVRAPMPEKPVWAEWTKVPSYIRPNMNGYRYEYMQLVTPEAFRAGTFNTVGMPIGTLIEKLAKRIETAHRRSQERKAREEVRQALAELFACREDPSKPGC